MMMLNNLLKTFYTKDAIKPIGSGATAGVTYSLLISYSSHSILSSIKKENTGIFNSTINITILVILSGITAAQSLFAKNVKNAYIKPKDETSKQNYQMLYSFGLSCGLNLAYLFLFRNKMSEQASTGLSGLLSGWLFSALKVIVFDIGIAVCEVYLMQLATKKSSNTENQDNIKTTENFLRLLQVFLITSKCLFQINSLSSNSDKSAEKLLQDPQFFSSLAFTLVGSAIQFKKCLDPNIESKYEFTGITNFVVKYASEQLIEK